MATQWVTYLYQAVVYAKWVEQKLKEDIIQLGRESIVEIRLKSDIVNKPNEVVDVIDEERKVESAGKPPVSKISTDTSDKGMSPKTSSTLPTRNPNSNGRLQLDRNRAATEFKIEVEEIIKEKADYGRSQSTMLTDNDLKLDEKVNFQSFEILKLLGSGAFGKVYKVISHIIQYAKQSIDNYI